MRQGYTGALKVDGELKTTRCRSKILNAINRSTSPIRSDANRIYQEVINIPIRRVLYIYGRCMNRGSEVEENNGLRC